MKFFGKENKYYDIHLLQIENMALIRSFPKSLYTQGLKFQVLCREAM